jgi:hypothetical protein
VAALEGRKEVTPGADWFPAGRYSVTRGEGAGRAIRSRCWYSPASGEQSHGNLRDAEGLEDGTWGGDGGQAGCVSLEPGRRELPTARSIGAHEDQALVVVWPSG